MATRIIYGLAATGALDRPVEGVGDFDTTADGEASQQAAENGIVLLKNAGDVLPLTKSARRVLVIGGHADVGVLSGGGSHR